MRVTLHSCPAFPAVVVPTAEEVRVWSVPLDRPPAEPAELLDGLTPDERDRAERYRAGSVRDQFIIGRAFLRRILAGCLNTRPHAVPITYTASGKPILAGGELHFNLTHTAGLALIALSTVRVGIDVEGRREVPGMDGLVERFFSRIECDGYRRLAQLVRPRAFFRGWTCKEAVIKAAGATVQCLDAFDVELNPDLPPTVLAVRDPMLAGLGWSVVDWDAAPGFAAAIAVETGATLRMEV